MQVVTEIYKITSKFPDSEKFGITSQMNRAAVSIPANIAEGAGRSGHKSFRYFLQVSKGSVSELDTLLEVALNIGLIEDSVYDKIEAQLTEASKLLNGLYKSLEE